MLTDSQLRIIDRAVEIWKRALSNPVHDNLSESEKRDSGNFFMLAMNELQTKQACENVPDFEKLLPVLRRKIIEAIEEKTARYPDARTFLTLYVDYGADRILSESASEAAVKVMWPIKTNMHIEDGRVSFSMGYGRPEVYHYPLAEGHWLICQLSGEDIKKLTTLTKTTLSRIGFTVE